MNRRRFINSLAFTTLASTLPLSACMASRESRAQLQFSEDQWRKRLSQDQFAVLRKDGTEPSGSSPLNAEKREGTFICAGCNQPLFDSSAKYESHTGWPSFWQPVKKENIGTKTDFKLILPRTEYHCSRCGGHQGHIFKDGPKPTGLRYCNNGVALQFVEKGVKLPALVGV